MSRLSIVFAVASVALALSAPTAGMAEPASTPAIIRSGDVAVAPTPWVAEGPTKLFTQAQWFWGGRSYCLYDFGWHGPGYYLCGYATRRGYGWGGAPGWHGWRGYRGPVYRGGGRDGDWHGDHDRGRHEGWRGGDHDRGEHRGWRDGRHDDHDEGHEGHHH